MVEQKIQQVVQEALVEQKVQAVIQVVQDVHVVDALPVVKNVSQYM